MAAVGQSLPPTRPSHSPPLPISPKAKERPLPPLPSDDAQREALPATSAMIPNASAVALGKRRAAPLVTISPSEGVRRMLHDPSILSSLLEAMQWSPFHALLSTCRTFRRVFTRPELRDVILSRFVPGYRLALGNREITQLAVDMTIADLALFQMSQEYPLHTYPMHALAVLGSPRYVVARPPTDPYTRRLVALTQAHTRMVLLLQALVHSGFALTSPLDSDDFALWPSPQSAPLLSGVRELVFPKPLAVFEADNSHQKDRADVPGSARANGRRASTGTLHRRYSTSERPRASSDFSIRSSLSRSRSRLRPVLSVLNGGPKVPLPPPSDNPPALSYYVGSWRRTLGHGKAASASCAVSDEEDELLPRPRFHERRSSSMHRSVESSTGSSSPTSSRSNTHTDYTTDASSISPRESAKPLYPYASAGRPMPTSPHDINMATSRFRAPILRVFVPCQQLDEVAITACEEQLMDADLWKHLSTGDIVCNFGFVPPPEPDSASQPSTPVSKSERERAGHRRRWLLFNGYCLVHYSPPSPPPVHTCLTLPSPFYFSHILPPFTDPRFVLALPPLASAPAVRAPRARGGADGPFAQLTLSHVRARVASPHSPGGYALVRRYIWLARIPYVGPHSRTEAGDALGEGWQGEWVLEAEGTKEGRQHLLDAVRPAADGTTRRGLWEVVRDKSGGGRIWMRLIAPDIDAHAPDFNINSIHSTD